MWPYTANKGRLFYGDLGVIPLKDHVVYFDAKKEEIVDYVEILKNKRYSMIPLSFSINKYRYGCLFNNPAAGLIKIGLFENRGNQLLVKANHHSPGSERHNVFLKGDTVLVIGPYLSGYRRALDIYDENSMTPSPRSIDGMNRFFKENRAYSLWRYDQTLTPIDSTDMITRKGKDLEELLYLYLPVAADVDKQGNIYLVHSSDNYLIRSYTQELKLTAEFRCKNRNFIAIPGQLMQGDADKLRATEGSHSVVYALYKTGDYLVSSFYQNPEGFDPPQPPYYYDIHSLTGKRIASGKLDFPIFSKDEQGTLYLYVELEGRSWLSDNEYYLVGIPLEWLLSGKTSKTDITSTIDRYLNDHKGIR